MSHTLGLALQLLLLAAICAEAARAPAAPHAQPAQPTFPAAGSSQQLAHAADRIIVRFKSAAGAKAASRPKVVRLKAGADARAAVAAYRKRPDVAYAVLDHVLRPDALPNDAKWSSQWGLKRVGAPAAWDTTTGSEAVTVCVIDSGVDYTHPDIAPNMHPELGWNQLAQNNQPMDDLNHGTHVAGIIGAAGNNANTIAGVNWQVRILACKFMDAAGYGYTSDAIACINYCASKGARVINASWGGSTTPNQAMIDAINGAGAAGALFVNSAGNNNQQDLDATVSYPPSYKLPTQLVVASVGSTAALSTFSNKGATTVQLAAPGEWIMSTLPNNTAGYMSGTSMAAPIVSGAAALALAKNPGLTTQQLRQAILDTVEPLASLSGTCSTGGLLNVAALIASVPASGSQPTPSPVQPSPSPVEPSPSPVQPSPSPVQPSPSPVQPSPSPVQPSPSPVQPSPSPVQPSPSPVQPSPSPSPVLAAAFYPISATQSADATTSTKAAKAFDKLPGTYAKTKAAAAPWWAGVLRRSTQSALSVSAVVITVPADATLAAQLKNVEVRVGSVQPTATKKPSTVNTVCASTAGQLGAPGAEVRLACSGGAIAGKIVSVHIKSAAGVVTDVLGLAEVRVEATALTATAKRAGPRRALGEQ